MAFWLRPMSVARHGSCILVATVVSLAVVVCCQRPATAQVDTEAARNARAALIELRQRYGDTSNWRLWEERLAADDLDRELMAGQYADHRVIDHAAEVLAKSRKSQSLPPAFVRLADALAARSAELAPIRPEEWPAECRRQAESFAAVDPQDLARRKQRIERQFESLERRIPSLREEGSRWSNYLDWPATKRVAAADPADVAALAALPDEAALNKMETRWAASLTVWDAPELVEASFSVQGYIRKLRALRKGETAEQHAAAWNELADLLEARRVTPETPSGAAETTEQPAADNKEKPADKSDEADSAEKPATEKATEEGADAADDEPAESAPAPSAPSPQSSAARIAELLAGRESLGQSSRLTASIRRELSHPNVVARIDADWMASQMRTTIDERQEIDTIYGGTRSRGTGRIKGIAALGLVPSHSTARWRIEMQATARSNTVGSEQGVSVDSRGTTHIRGQKLFTLSASGLTAEGATADADTNVEIININAGGGARGRRAPGEVRARIPAVEADVSADAERTTVARLDAEGGKLVERFNNNYHENFRNPWITSGRLLPRIRAASTEQALHWECFLAPAYGMAADAPPPAFDSGGGVVVCLAESAMEQQAASAWGGKRMTGRELLESLKEVLGESASDPSASDESDEAAESGAPAEPAEPDWVVTFADVPCRVRIADGIVTASYFFTSYEQGDSSFPAMTMQVAYAVEERDGKLALVRQGIPSVMPTPHADGTTQRLIGRQRTLRIMAQRQFDLMLSQEVVWSGMELPVASAQSASAQSASPPVMRVNKAQATDGWLQVGLRSEPSAKTP